jgi:hypothetical protein
VLLRGTIAVQLRSESDAMSSQSMLDRIFLRQCAFIMRLYDRRDPAFVWSNASIGMTLSACVVAFLCMASVAAVFRNQLPVPFNPYIAPKNILLVQFGAMGLLAYVWVELRFRKFKDDVSAAQSFMYGNNMFLLFLELLFHVLCIALMGFLAYKFRIRGPA